MKEMPISEFSVKSLEVIERVRMTGETIRLTRFGLPVADIVPTGPPPDRDAWLGSLKGSVEIRGDIISPATDEDEWDALRD